HVSGGLRVWDVDPVTMAATLLGSTSLMSSGRRTDILSVAWQTLTDGRLLLANSSRDGMVRIWEADPVTGSLAERWAIAAHGSSDAFSVAWQGLPGGRLLLVSGGWDNRARVWE